MYKFKFKGMNFECNLNDLQVVNDLLQQFDNDETLIEIIQNKEQYRAINNSVRIEQLELDNVDLWYENMTLKDNVASNEQEIADLWYQIVATGGNE